MPEWSDTAVILSSRPHGEQSALVTVLTCENGRQAGLVRGGQGKTLRGVLQTGNAVTANWRARLAEHLGTMTVEMLNPYASAVMDDPLRLTGLVSACGIIEVSLAEGEPCPAVYDATIALIEVMAGEATGDAEWLAAYIRWEVAMLGIAGYALDLTRCAVTGAGSGLGYVSPRTGVAVTPDAAGEHIPRLLVLPRFLGGVTGGDNKTEAQDLLDGLELTRYFFEHRVFAAHHKPLPRARTGLQTQAAQKLGADSYIKDESEGNGE